ncbi:collagenase [Chitinimonas sp. BJB300]|uniref:collagenase n=1 Tax=Chitinimonas sp. BJB300 TaxID=1559339 RepID=UPI000C0C5ADA|nr:collagenase [Chitinimonas sp. BJB300]PHV09679.1 hypothetical protein CSQ89_20380 [Chitinimonas sp. BJB300]TSJ84613.1 hypothetical protein FG002_019465 [Chitinimonas sp. BJB300]
MTKTTKQYRLTPLFLIVGALFLPAEADVGVPKKNNASTSEAIKTQDYESYERSLDRARQQRDMQKKNMEAAQKSCNMGALAYATGNDLLKAIKTFSCYQDLFYDNGYERQLFEESRLNTVVEELLRLAGRYTETYKEDELIAILGYVEAAYNYRFYNDKQFEYSFAMKQRIKQGLELMLNSQASRISDYSNHKKLKMIYDTIYFSRDYVNYLPILKAKMLEIGSNFFKDDESLAAIKSMFKTWIQVTRVNLDDPYIGLKPRYELDANKIVVNDSSYFSAFKSFYNNNISLLDTKYEEVLESAAISLAGGLNYEQLRPKIRPQIKEILRGLDINGRGSNVYVAVVGAVDSYDVDKKSQRNNCAEYSTCDIKERWVERNMPSKKSCSTYVRIIAQPEIPAARLDEACRLVMAEEKLFIYSLFGITPDKASMVGGTKERPKFDSGLEMVLFKNKNEYAKIGRAVFKIETNNGGYQLEGNTGEIGNVQRFWAYHKDGVDGTDELIGQYIWNLKHEFIHYLDNVFNQADYADFFSNETRLVWWQEGVAEYFSKQNSYPNAIEVARKKTYTLSQIFNHTYDMSDYFGRAYTWGYLGVRFMFERHRDDVEKMLLIIRSGKPKEYTKFIFTDIGTRYDSEFNQWLNTVSEGGEFAGARYAGGVNVVTPNRGVGKITFDPNKDYKHNDSVLIYGNPYTYSLLEKGQVNVKDSTTGWRCIPLTCNKARPYEWSSQLGYWTPGGDGATGGTTKTGGGTTTTTTTTTTGAGGTTTTTGGGTTKTGGGGGTTTTGGGGTTKSADQFDANRQYRNLDQTVFEGRTYSYNVIVDGKPSSDYPPIYGSTCAPVACTSQNPWRNSDNRVQSFWQEGQVTTGGGATSGGGTTRSANQFSIYQQYFDQDQTVYEGRTYRMTIKQDGKPAGTSYYLYGGNCAPASCQAGRPFVSSDGRSTGYWQ